MDTQVKLFLLGPFRAERDGQPLTAFKSTKVRALLAYLAVEREQPHHRDVLADLLWPDSSNTSALALLRDALSNLRLVLGDRDAEIPCIETGRNTLQISADSAVWMDIPEFEALTRSDGDINALKHAIDLYLGDFLEGFSLPDNLDFESWLRLQREDYRRRMQQTLYRLTTHYLQEGDYSAAQRTARRQLRLDAYAEEAHRQLLRALALDGQRNQALSHYDEYREMVAVELRTDPDIRTTALYQRIRDHRLPPESAELHALTGSTASTPEHNGSPSFVGRETELTKLESALGRAQRGTGQVLLVIGEAGSGKTSLMQAFLQRVVAVNGASISTTAPTAAWGACNAQIGGGDPYFPFREILRLLVGDFDVSTLSSCLTPALAQRLEALVPEVVTTLRALGPDLIGTLLPADDRLAPLGGARARRPSNPPLPVAICDQVTRVLVALARHHTLVLILEDLHWADGSTLNLLLHLGRRLQEARILLIASYRPDEASPALEEAVRELQRRWGNITLDLDRAAGRAFVDAFIDSTPNALGSAFRDRLYHQTGGHALFTVALVQQLQAEGALIRNADGAWVAKHDLDWHYLPPQVEAVIGTRVAHLPDDLQELLTVASVEGETFTAEVVAQALRRPIDAVQQALSGPLRRSYQWIDAQGLERAGAQRVARYRFRHSLFQQYLYAQLDAVQRARWHEAVGKALETLHAGRPDAAARLAYHFEAAGMIDKAIKYLIRAGDYAYRLSAPAEAIDLCRRGLALLEQLPQSAARDKRELALQMGLDMPLFVTQGWGAPERAEALNRAHELAQALGATKGMLPILKSLADVSTARAKHEQALAYAERALEMAQDLGDRTYEALGYRMSGTSRFFLAHFEEARAHLEEGLACYEALVQSAADPGRPPAAIPNIEEIVFLWVWLPFILFAQGYPEQAMARAQEAMAHIPPDGPAHAQAKMLTAVGGAFYATCRQPRVALGYAEELLALAETHNLPAFQGWALFYRGWSHAALGETEIGLAEMATGRERLSATGTEASLVQLFTLLTEAYIRAGLYDRAAEVLTQGLHIADQTGANCYLAEMHRLRGELCRVRSSPTNAEDHFLKAIDVARSQAAKLWELRATVSLAQLWRSQGRSAEAERRVAGIYGWFTEGFDLPDLLAARELLNTPGS